MKINPQQLVPIKPLKAGIKTAEEQLQSARELKKAYCDFVGKTFFGQMMKSMRSTVKEPAYFHGGQAEKAFQSQLDQQLTDTMSDASASQIANPMFERQFPQQARLLADAEKQSHDGMTSMASLRRY